MTKPGGIVIMDFINHCSLWELLRYRNWRALLQSWLLAGGAKYEQFGPFGIRRFYGQFGLQLVRLHYIGAVPPLKNCLSTHHYQLLEKFFPKKECGRVILATFINNKEEA